MSIRYRWRSIGFDLDLFKEIFEFKCKLGVFPTSVEDAISWISSNMMELCDAAGRRTRRDDQGRKAVVVRPLRNPEEFASASEEGGLGVCEMRWSRMEEAYRRAKLSFRLEIKRTKIASWKELIESIKGALWGRL